MRGIYLPLMTPFNSAGNVAYELLEDMINHHIANGVDGFYVGGSSSECFMMTLEERKRVFQSVAQINAGRVPLIAHVGAISLHEVYQLVDSAVCANYSAISATPPFYYGFTKQEVNHYYCSIAQYSALPLLLYNIPGTTGVHFSHQELFQLAEMENVVGIKHTTSDMFFIERLRAKQPQAVIFHGEDTMLVNGLQMGASGGIGSTYNLMSKWYVGIYQAMMQSEVEKAMELQHKANAVTEQLLSCGVYQSIKFAMGELGVNYGVCREPLLPLSIEHKRQVSTLLSDIG